MSRGKKSSKLLWVVKSCDTSYVKHTHTHTLTLFAQIKAINCVSIKVLLTCFSWEAFQCIRGCFTALMEGDGNQTERWRREIKSCEYSSFNIMTTSAASMNHQSGANSELSGRRLQQRASWWGGGSGNKQTFCVCFPFLSPLPALMPTKSVTFFQTGNTLAELTWRAEPRRSHRGRWQDPHSA